MRGIEPLGESHSSRKGGGNRQREGCTDPKKKEQKQRIRNLSITSHEHPGRRETILGGFQKEKRKV